MRLFVVAVLAASLLTVSACTNGGTGNSTAGEGAPAIVTPTPAPTTAPTPFGGKGQLVFRPGSVDRAPPDVKIPKQAGSGGVIISPALYGNYATRFYKGHTLLFADNDEFLVARDPLPMNANGHVVADDSLVLFSVPKFGLCWYLKEHEPRQYVVTSPVNAGAQTRSPMMIEAVDGSLVIVTKLPFCQATP
jgi:hypothetical protein